MGDPTNAPFYSNRAAALMKLADFGYAFRDCEKCIELDPTFVKAYKRLASIHNLNKDYHNAIDCYKKAMQYAPDDSDLEMESNIVRFSTARPRATLRNVRFAKSVRWLILRFRSFWPTPWWTNFSKTCRRVVTKQRP